MCAGNPTVWVGLLTTHIMFTDFCMQLEIFSFLKLDQCFSSSCEYVRRIFELVTTPYLSLNALCPLKFISFFMATKGRTQSAPTITSPCCLKELRFQKNSKVSSEKLNYLGYRKIYVVVLVMKHSFIPLVSLQ